jgi:hypothetical protein
VTGLGPGDLAAVCSHCLAHREEITPAELARQCEGLRRTQIDCGDDILFPGIPVPALHPGPCPACGSARYVIAVWPEVARRFGPAGLGPPGLGPHD